MTDGGRSSSNGALTALVAINLLVSVAALVLAALAYVDGHRTSAPPIAAAATQAAAAPGALGASDQRDILGEPDRSAIPQPGETIITPIRPRQLVAPVDDGAASSPASTPSSAPPAPGPGGVIAWSEAGKYVGRDVTVEGRIVDSGKSRDGKLVFLNFAPYTPTSDAFYIVIYESALNGWTQPPETYFLDKTVRATGKVYTYRDRPQIRVVDPKQLTLAP